jgi:hypothetical protein
MDFSQELNDVPKIETDTKVSHTPYFPSVDMDAILGDSHLLSTPVSSKARILSPSSCKAYSHSTLRALLSDIITDILFNKLLIDSTISACISGIGLGRPVSLILAGPTGHQPAVEKLLKAANVKYEVKQHNLNNWASTRSDSGAIAVVGMAARLPGSDTVEGFFENLMKGKVQLQKVRTSSLKPSMYVLMCARSLNPDLMSMLSMIRLAQQHTRRRQIKEHFSTGQAISTTASSAFRLAKLFRWIHFNVCYSLPAGRLWRWLGTQEMPHHPRKAIASQHISGRLRTTGAMYSTAMTTSMSITFPACRERSAQVASHITTNGEVAHIRSTLRAPQAQQQFTWLAKLWLLTNAIQLLLVVDRFL